MKIKKIIALILVVCISVGACACSNHNWLYNGHQKSEAHGKTQTLKYDTDYPDDVLVAEANVITVEKATEDLLKNMYHECLQVGVVTFDNLTLSYPDFDSIEATYWFDISIRYEYGNENYRAKVIYFETTDSYGRSEFAFSKTDSDIWQINSTFTTLGKWKYDGKDTHICVNFIRTHDSGYVVEYEIKYYASYWTGSRWVESVSDGEVIVYGDNQWDGDNYYLSIDLGDFYNESEQTMDRGYVKVYLSGGVYWDALHANGGPFRLTKV